MSSCTFHAKRSMFGLLPNVPPLVILAERHQIRLYMVYVHGYGRPFIEGMETNGNSKVINGIRAHYCDSRACTLAPMYTHMHIHTQTHTQKCTHVWTHTHTPTHSLTSTREKNRTSAAVIRRAKRDGTLASPKGIKATTLNSLRSAPVWPSTLDSPSSFFSLFAAPTSSQSPPSRPQISPPSPAAARGPRGSELLQDPGQHTDGAYPGSIESSSSSSSSRSDVGSSSRSDLGSSTKESSSVGTLSKSASGRDGSAIKESRSRSDRDSSRSSSSSSSSGENDGKRGQRASLGRGGSGSGRVWAMDPPELTKAISHCPSLKGETQPFNPC